MHTNALRTAEYFVPAPARRQRTRSKLNILLVEDEASDRLLAEAALEDAHIHYEMHALQDGREVLPCLLGQGKYQYARKTDILMLDLSLPARDGFEILADLAEHSEHFSDLAILILTADTHCAFLKQSYGLNIAAYMTKPCTAAKMRAALAAAGA